MKGKGKVLIVDDDPKMGKLLKLKLTKAGYETEYFSSGGEALAKIAQVKPHIIISDIQMPEMDGYEFCERLRQDPLTAAIPFIFLSGKTDTSDQLEGLRLGADDYVCKPVKVPFLLERMNKVRERAAKARSFKSQADFSGNLAQMNLNDVMQIVESNHKSGELVFLTLDGKTIGKILFNKGNLVNAYLNSLEGTEAFYSLMGEEEGLFEFYGRTVDEPEIITITNMAALLQGSRLIDESKSLYSKLPNLDVYLSMKDDEIPPEIEDRSGKDRIQVLRELIMKPLPAREIINSGKMSLPRAAAILAELVNSGLVEIHEKKPVMPSTQAPVENLRIDKGLVKLLENVELHKLTGILNIEGRNAKEAIFLRNGGIIHAFHGKVTAKKALFRIFAEKGGSPKFQRLPVVVNATIEESLTVLIEEGNREAVKLKDLRKASFNNNVIVNTRNVKKLANLKRPGIRNVFALVQQHGRLQEIIDASPFTDLRTYNHLLTMVKLGVIEIEKEKRIKN